jgi:hypothetical protein
MKGSPRPYAEIYVQELENLARGYPVFRPEKNIHIGDVGFFSKNNDQPFERLFNVFCEAADPGNRAHGVPPGFITFEAYLRQCGVHRGPDERSLYDITPEYYHPMEFKSTSSITREYRTKASTYAFPLLLIYIPLL